MTFPWTDAAGLASPYAVIAMLVWLIVRLIDAEKVFQQTLAELAESTHRLCIMLDEDRLESTRELLRVLASLDQKLVDLADPGRRDLLEHLLEVLEGRSAA